MDEPDDQRPTAAMGVATPPEGVPTTALPHAKPARPANDGRVGAGSEIGGYIVDGVIGSGGMGVVYAATHPVIGKRAAIKVLRSELSKEPAAVERFIFEARAVNQIGHPNIVDVFAFGTLPDGRSYYVMDLLVGETLRKRLKRGPLHVSEAASVIDDTASALLAVHAKSFIHRDLKPDNVFMVEVDGRWPEVKLLDFGLVKLLTSEQIRTLTGSVMGTPRYMSPEQARGDAIDARSDVYALGVMAYELLCGETPFAHHVGVDVLVAHSEEAIPSLAARVPTLPIELVQLVEAMVAKNADDRPTLAAARVVLKRLKGTKIPTMTAAGLRMPESGAPPTVVEMPRFRDHVDAGDSHSMEATAPRMPPQSAPHAAEPPPVEREPERLPSTPSMPPPMQQQPMQQPMQPQSMLQQPMPPQSMQPQSMPPQSMQPQSMQPSSMQPQSMQPQSMPPQSMQPSQQMPMQSMQPSQQMSMQSMHPPQPMQPQQMPMQSMQPSQPMPSQRHPSMPPYAPHPSLPPHATGPQYVHPVQSYPSGAVPAQVAPVAQPPARARASRSWLVIVLVALVVSAIGVAIVLNT